MLRNALQALPMASLSLIPLLILSFLAYIVVIAVLWKKGKNIEALLVWNSLMLYVIALILLLK